MDFLTILFKMVALISDACGNADKLSGALVSCGVVQAAAALFLIISRTPGGILLHHGKVPFYSYYGMLISVFIFGLLEASAGFWVSSDVIGRPSCGSPAGKTILWVSILPIVVVAALGGFIILH